MLVFKVNDRVVLRGGSWGSTQVEGKVGVVIRVTDYSDEAEILVEGTNDFWYVWDVEHPLYRDGANDNAYETWPAYREKVDLPDDVRYMLAVEGYGEDTYFVEFDTELLQKHPDLSVKVAELMGLRMRYLEEDGRVA